MINVDHIETYGYEAAIRGMRNPMNSWNKSDSGQYGCPFHDEGKISGYSIGSNDLKLMKTLCKAGTEHRKYLRMIHASMDITAPLYWWKEFDTYKIGTTANSCSTMHKIAAKEFTVDDFSYEHLFSLGTLRIVIDDLNDNRAMYLGTKNKDYWWQMIQLLPTSYNQKRTVDMNYENVLTIIHQRKGHKLDEWNDFVKTLKELPYVGELYEKGD